MDTSVEEVGFEEMVEYVLKRKNTVAKYIATRTILNLCKQKVNRYGVWVYRIWWEQE